MEQRTVLGITTEEASVKGWIFLFTEKEIFYVKTFAVTILEPQKDIFLQIETRKIPFWFFSETLHLWKQSVK